MLLNEKIKLLRKNKNVTQKELADTLGVSKQLLSGWESNYSVPTIYKLIDLAYYFGVSTDYLLGLETEKKISVSGLTEEEISHVAQIINDLKKKDKE